jgi:hypothetical protein
MEREKIEKLLHYCRPAQKELKKILAGELVRQRGTERILNRDGFLYSPGSHPVLLIAHLDTVHKQTPSMFYIDKTDSADGDLWCEEGIGGDDRCGVFIIMELIKALDCHVLFTEDEEIGGRGAIKFCESGISPEVQFIVEFDRQGKDDAVFYNCDNPDFTAFVEEYGFRQEEGTFSDISYIAPALALGAVNLSSGYYHAHSLREIIRIADVESIIERAARLIANVSTKYEYVERKYPDWDWEPGDWKWSEKNDDVICPRCDSQIADALFLDYCPYCYTELILSCDYCGYDVRLSDCAMSNGGVYCKYCLEEDRTFSATFVSVGSGKFSRPERTFF